ncbi:MAG: hypothetical protein WBH56_08290 [Bacteroidota bacterium]
MIQISNQYLTAQILHPLHDRDRLGPRFCTGCYIHQIEERRAGPLFSGPEYPSPTPSVINGQGLPDVFQHTLYTDPEEVPGRKLIIGVGLVENDPGLKNSDSHFSCRVQKECEWSMDQESDSLTMETHQEEGKWSLDLKRRVELKERTIRLSTQIRNGGPAQLPVRWFAHPFFPVPPDGRCLKFEGRVSLPSNPAYVVDAEGWLSMRSDYQWPEGYFLEVEGVKGQLFRAIQNHPLLNRVELLGDFPLLKVAIWANDRTFSVEPFISARVQPGEELEWSMTYVFEGDVDEN